LFFTGSAVKSGSNCFVVSDKKSKTGGALIAADPHVGLMLPNFWVLVGFRSPTFHAVGITLPGMPMILIGRNSDIAWGGTNMLSLSSSLYDISSFSSEDFRKRKESIGVRWWVDRSVQIRETRLGPVISDASLFKKMNLPPLALKWRGHDPSDETTALLKVNRASNWEEFREAFETYAVSGQNFLYADTKGNIGQLLALEFIPTAGRVGRLPIGNPSEPAHVWKDGIRSTDLPAAFNPAEGYLVSVNNVPVRTEPPISLFGNWNDRYHTLSDSLKRNQAVTVKDLMEVQRDVSSQDALSLARVIIEKGKSIRGRGRDVIEALTAWDGLYDTASRGASALTLTASHLVSAYYEQDYGRDTADTLRGSPAVYTFLAEDISEDQSTVRLYQALERAAEDFEKYPTWGDLHFLRLEHILGRAPFIGKRYRFGEYPVPGSTNTVMKSAHLLTDEPHFVTYGANSRFVADLSDPDENYFILLGGQDGFLGSRNYLDMFDLWKEGRYVQFPLRLESIKRSFHHVMKLGSGS
jgi:penicillin amidase